MDIFCLHDFCSLTIILTYHFSSSFILSNSLHLSSIYRLTSQWPYCLDWIEKIKKTSDKIMEILKKNMIPVGIEPEFNFFFLRNDVYQGDMDLRPLSDYFCLLFESLHILVDLCYKSVSSILICYRLYYLVYIK